MKESLLKAVVEKSRARQLPQIEDRRRIRTTARLSQREMAEALDVDTSTVSRWESGETPARSTAEAYGELLRRLQAAQVPNNE
jgi:DNA-binding transcriptional regulator YiaG